MPSHNQDCYQPAAEPADDLQALLADRLPDAPTTCARCGAAARTYLDRRGGQWVRLCLACYRAGLRDGRAD